MFTSKLLAFVNTLLSRKWSDEEVVEDLQYLKDELTTRLENLTTYDEYVSEIESGHLVWSPAHESKEFWVENGLRIGSEGSGKTVKRLVELLKTSRDPQVLAIAAHDLAMYIAHGGEKAKQ